MCGASLDVFLLSAQLQHWREEKQQLMTLFCCKLQSRNTPGITELGQTYCMDAGALLQMSKYHIPEATMGFTLCVFQPKLSVAAVGVWMVDGGT